MRLYERNGYKTVQRDGIGANSLDLSDTNFIVKANGVVSKATVGGTIDGVNDTIGTFASDNQTNAQGKVLYTPTEVERLYEVEGTGQTIVFSADLVTSNTINLKVNGVAMTQETFATDNATTLTNIAAQIDSDFASTVLVSSDDGSHTITVVPKGLNSTVVITDVVVAGGASQATATVSDMTIAETDEDNYYDLASSNVVNLSTKSASTGQVQLIKRLSASNGAFKIVNL